jgi:hypothetical protein
VEQEAADKFFGGQRGDCAIPGGEGDAAIVEAAQTLVGDANAMRITAEIIEDLLGTSEGRLAVDDPFLLVQRVLPSGEGVGVGEVGTCAVEVELAGFASPGERGQDFAAKECADDGYGKQEATFALDRDPARAVGGEAPAGYDAVQVGMKAQLARPGVQDGGDAQQGATAVGIEPELQQGARRGEEEDLEEADPVAQGQGLALLGHGEDDMEVVDRQHALHALGNPLRLAQALALGTMPVAAGVVGGPRVTARIAHVEMPAKDGRPAGLDVAHGPALYRAECVALSISLAVGAEDVRDLEARPPLLPRRGRRRRRAGVHSGLPENARLVRAEDVERARDPAHVLL